MTGFGKASKEISNLPDGQGQASKKITVEVRSLNSKQMDLNLRMSYLYKAKELELRNEIAKQIERGKVDVSIYTESSLEAIPVAINKELAKNYFNELHSLSAELNANSVDLLAQVLRMPEVIKAEKEIAELDENEWKQVKQVVDEAIAEFQKFRDAEGATLNKEFDTRIKLLTDLLVKVNELDAPRIENIKQRIKNNIKDAIDPDKIDANRFEQELIYYIEKIDISEEKLRLQTHLDYFIATKQEPACGRKLGFIAQEIGREINTIGSKANDAGIQKIVVQMKDELEKIKEQLLNVL